MPFHLLSGVGINASLLSPAKATDFTHPHFLLFLSSLPHDSGYWLHHRKIQIFFIGSIRLAILFSLRASCLSGLPPKATRFDATVRNYPPCTEDTPSRTQNTAFSWSESAFASSPPGPPLQERSQLSRLMYSPVILLTGSPPFLIIKELSGCLNGPGPSGFRPSSQPYIY